ncbi:inactive pancreatic lipase-related protein 1 [Osmia lignaria lignaria]|uniref:inactive pancreatic lipase-related protein 1 n=1 Tax=Osmia lignaria lignaria TaxID=1437193 RepID=UPI00402B29DD
MVAPASLALLYPTLLTALMEANYTLIPTEDGVPHLVKIDYTPLTADELQTLAYNVESTSFTLFTRKNPTAGQNLRLNDANSIRSSHWDPNQVTVFVTHGWRSSGTSRACTLVRDAYLKATAYNVIVVDWNSVASNPTYRPAAHGVPNVADRVAKFINFMRTSVGLKTLATKLVGHSLGAHVSSLAAKTVSESSPIAEVVALDPAKPMFESNGPNDRVDKSHAKHVQVLHTCAAILGIKISIGSSDFFANGGESQPGCGINVTGQCAHGRAYEYFSESITNSRGFRAVAKNGAIAYMGGPTLDQSARGNYYFETNSQSPYARG